MKRIVSITLAFLLFAGITLSAVYAHRHLAPESVTTSVVTTGGPPDGTDVTQLTLAPGEDGIPTVR